MNSVETHENLDEVLEDLFRDDPNHTDFQRDVNDAYEKFDEGMYEKDSPIYQTASFGKGVAFGAVLQCMWEVKYEAEDRERERREKREREEREREEWERKEREKRERKEREEREPEEGTAGPEEGTAGPAPWEVDMEEFDVWCSKFCEPEESVKECARRNLLLHHPDKGGNQYVFDEVRQGSKKFKSIENCRPTA